jgi:hypothetical protein
MDVNQNSLAMLDHVKDAINCSFNNGHPGRDSILEIKIGEVKTHERYGVKFETTDEILVTCSWDPEPVHLNVTGTSTAHSMKTIIDWAMRACF